MGLLCPLAALAGGVGERLKAEPALGAIERLAMRAAVDTVRAPAADITSEAAREAAAAASAATEADDEEAAPGAASSADTSSPKRWYSAQYA